MVQTKSSLETQRLGREFGQKIKNGGVLFLFGDLGGGKTTFTQGLAQSLGIKRQIVSPTFLIMRTYELPGTTDQVFNHLDLYRIESEKDVHSLGLSEILENPGNIVVIEWAERLGKAKPKVRTEIHFEYIDENNRNIVINSYE